MRVPTYMPLFILTKSLIRVTYEETALPNDPDLKVYFSEVVHSGNLDSNAYTRTTVNIYAIDDVIGGYLIIIQIDNTNINY